MALKWQPHAPRPAAPLPYLHGGEDPRLLEVELYVNAALAQRVAAPAQVVVARPHTQLLGLAEVVPAQHAIAKLAQASELHPAQGGGEGSRGGSRGMWKSVCFPPPVIIPIVLHEGVG